MFISSTYWSLVELRGSLARLPLESRAVVVILESDLTNTVESLSSGKSCPVRGGRVVLPMNASSLKLWHKVGDKILECAGSDGVAEVWS